MEDEALDREKIYRTNGLEVMMVMKHFKMMVRKQAR